MRIKVFKFILSLEDYSVFYSMKKTSVRLLLLDNWAL